MSATRTGRFALFALGAVALLTVVLAFRPTATAPAQAGPRIASLWTFEGHVYTGEPHTYPPEAVPLYPVTVSLYRASSTCSRNTFVAETTTREDGYFSISVYDDDIGGAAYIQIAVPEGATWLGAAPEGHVCVGNSKVWFERPQSSYETIDGIVFWAEPIARPTATPTAIGPTPTPSRTRTRTVTPTPTRTRTATPTPTPTWKPLEITGVAWFPVSTPIVMQLLNPPDLTVRVIEMTQAVQCLDRVGAPACFNNELDLVEDRWTVARVYVQTNGDPVPNVHVRLHLYIDNLSGPHYTLDGYVTAVKNPQRANKLQSANFYFKPTGGNMDIRFYAEVNPTHSILETNYGNNRWPAYSTEYVTFKAQSPLELVPVLIDYIGDGSHKAPPSDYKTTFDEFMRIYPISQVNVHWSPVRVLPWSGNLKTEAEWEALLTALGTMRSKECSANQKGGVCSAHWYGLVDTDMPLASIGGMGWIPYYATGTKDWQAAGLISNKGIAVHEVGHNLGRWHAPCGVNDDLDTNYPWSDGKIHDVGWDIVGNKTIPATDPDLMSYCHPEWISSYNWKHMLARREGLVPAAGAPTMFSATQPGPYVQIGGRITETAALFHPFEQLTLPAGSDDAPGAGPLRIELQDAEGAPLFVRFCDVLPNGSQYPQPGGTFSEVMPLPEGARWARLYRGAAMLAERWLSFNPPRVNVAQPANFQEWGPEGWHTLAWEAGDRDGGPLNYAVLVSTDAGVTWASLAAGLTVPWMQVNSRYLAGGETVFRVVASDGFNTGHGDSPPVFVAPKPPTVVISKPAPGDLLMPGIPVMLTGAAYDTEDGTLPDSALEWRSDRDGWLGEGSTLVLPALSRGWHFLSLHARDGQGMETVATVRVFVGYRVTVPVVRRGP